MQTLKVIVCAWGVFSSSQSVVFQLTQTGQRRFGCALQSWDNGRRKAGFFSSNVASLCYNLE